MCFFFLNITPHGRCRFYDVACFLEVSDFETSLLLEIFFGLIVNSANMQATWLRHVIGHSSWSGAAILGASHQWCCTGDSQGVGGDHAGRLPRYAPQQRRKKAISLLVADGEQGP